MTEKKGLKRRVRARMEKTGERYTTARAHLTREPEPEPEQAPEPRDRVADETVVARTGRTAEEWFAALDAWGAAARPHAEIARHLRDEHGVSGWWAQKLTVEYERARGLRAVHEGPGGWSVGASRTVAVPVERLFAAFADEAERARWLPGVELRVRTARAPRSARFDWGDGPSRVVADFAAKGADKSTVAVQHERLSGADEAATRKAFWRERLAELKRLLEAS